jgi:hypothetical protein
MTFVLFLLVFKTRNHATCFCLNWLCISLVLPCQAVSTNASKEAALEKVLSKMKSDWQSASFRVVPYKETGTYVVGGVDEIQALLDDHIVKTQSMRASPFIKALEGEVLPWEALLLASQVGCGNRGAWEGRMHAKRVKCL